MKNVSLLLGTLALLFGINAIAAKKANTTKTTDPVATTVVQEKQEGTDQNAKVEQNQAAPTGDNTVVAPKAEDDVQEQAKPVEEPAK